MIKYLIQIMGFHIKSLEVIVIKSYLFLDSVFFETLDDFLGEVCPGMCTSKAIDMKVSEQDHSGSR